MLQWLIHIHCIQGSIIICSLNIWPSLPWNNHLLVAMAINLWFTTNQAKKSYNYIHDLIRTWWDKEKPKANMNLSFKNINFQLNENLNSKSYMMWKRASVFIS